MTFEAYSDSQIALFNRYLDDNLGRFRNSVSQRFSPLLDAMQYSLDGGGKRLRPLLVLSSAQYLGLSSESVLPAAAALEYIHTYSLIHDDLPALDDDDTRRGKASSHKQFGEAMAILAGDALLTEAFGQVLQLSSHGFPPAHCLAAIELIVQYAGVRGMVGGQVLDVTTQELTYSLPELEFIHIHKTGALILGAVLLPTRLVPVEEVKLQKLRRYGEALGLAFQISDDILDAETSFRYSRGPRKKPKPSYAAVMGRTEMKEKLNRLIDSAISAIAPEGERAKALVGIAEFIRDRKR
ncbi:polyprenyl synthetase family protein [bacterium]|nr:polyprenyl synthetase family protein [bacterium]